MRDGRWMRRVRVGMLSVRGCCYVVLGSGNSQLVGAIGHRFTAVTLLF